MKWEMCLEEKKNTDLAEIISLNCFTSRQHYCQ